MKQFSISGALPLLALVSMTACVDNKYDLSDIDTTTEIKVKDLTVPINLDVVKLGDIISIKEGSELTEVTLNGEKIYAVNKAGTFSSDPISIPSFSAPAPQVNLGPLLFISSASAGSSSASSTRAGGDFTFPLGNTSTSDLIFEVSDLDPAIISVEAIQTSPMNVRISFDASSFNDMATFELKNVNVNLPECLDIEIPAGSPLTLTDKGIRIDSLSLGTNGMAEVNFNVLGIKKTTPSAIQISDSGSNLSVEGKVSISGGEIDVTLRDSASSSSVPTSIYVDIDFRFSNLIATAFSGEVNYKVDGIHIPSVELGDLPDFLAGDETNLVLANPQIYLSLNNPVSSYGLSYQSGLSIIPVRDGVDGSWLTLDNNAVFSIAGDANLSNLYLSPSALSEENDIPADYRNPAPVHYAFTSLSDAVAGAGLPQELKIELDNPQIPTQHVENFLLGTTLDPVEGKWEFLAPLALKTGSSKIVYTDRDTGWFSDDDDDLTVNELTISMIVDSSLPLDAELSGSPLDKSGNAIPGVEILPQTIHANAKDQSIVLTLKGTIKELDGIEYRVTVVPSSEEALSPDQTLTLKNIRAKVSGSYITKF